MKFGIELAPWGELADPWKLADRAKAAEAAGWDGFFVWDAIFHDAQHLPKADPWVALAAVAIVTDRMRLGTMVTPVPRRRPWKLARETVTLDHLSRGRLTLGVGLGDPSIEEFVWFGEPGINHRTRGRMLDEGLEILAGLWSGEPFAFDGDVYRLHEVTFTPAPIQKPRIPIWVGGWLPNPAPLRRAARWDGACLGSVSGNLSVKDLRAMVAAIGQYRKISEPIDIVVADRPPANDEGQQPGKKVLVRRVQRLEDAGATWWLTKVGAFPTSIVDEIIRRGPPS